MPLLRLRLGLRSTDISSRERFLSPLSSSWLDGPRSSFWLLGAWVLSTAVFVVLTLILGGPSQADASQSAYSALLIAHGDWACAYPSAAYSHLASGFSVTSASPFYTMLSAVAMRLMNLGSSVPFPAVTSMGRHCSSALTVVSNWAQSTNVMAPILRIGFVTWLVLAAGAVSVLRACGRGRSGRQGATLLILATSAPVFACVESFFHPEDLLAMGLVLLAVAGVVTQRPVLAGVLLGVGLLTQLFVVLVFAPVVIVLTARDRGRFGTGLAVALFAVAGPLIVVTSGRVVHAIVMGTSRAGLANVRSAGGTVVFSADLHGVWLFLASRAAPIAATVAISLYAFWRLGERVREPILVVSLVGVCLSTRLVFEVNAFNYYYMAGIVSLVVLDALRGRFSGRTFALIWLVTLAYSPIAWGFRFGEHAAGPFLRALLPFAVAVPVVVVVVGDVLRRRPSWYLLVWLGLVVLAFVRIPLPETQYRAVIPSWCWQILLVTPLLYLLSAPLRDAVQSRDGGRRPSPVKVVGA